MQFRGSLNDQLKGRWREVYATCGLQFDCEQRERGGWVNFLDPTKESRNRDPNAGYSVESGWFRSFATDTQLSPWAFIVAVQGSTEDYWRRLVSERLLMQRQPIAEENKYARAQQILANAVRCERGGLVDRYLKVRGVDVPSLRFAYEVSMNVYDNAKIVGEQVPHMLHRFVRREPDGTTEVTAIHVVPLTKDARRYEYTVSTDPMTGTVTTAKADKKIHNLKAGGIQSALIPVFSEPNAVHLVIAEGVESAYAAAALTNFTANAFAAGNAGNLAAYSPSRNGLDRYSKITIYGDSEPTGIADAITLWRRLKQRADMAGKIIELAISGVSINPDSKDPLDLLNERNGF